MNFSQQFRAILRKEFVQEFQSKFMINTMLMFSILLIFIVAFPFNALEVAEETKTILLWVIIYFAATTGLSSTFQKEVDRQTNIYLKLHFQPQAVFWGKAVFNLTALVVVCFLVLIVYSSFFHFYSALDGSILVLLLLCFVGLAVNGTLLSALIAQSAQSGVLYAIIGFPVLFPLFLLGINGTNTLLTAAEPDIMLWVSIAVYDLLSVALSYLLFEPIWETM